VELSGVNKTAGTSKTGVKKRIFGVMMLRTNSRNALKLLN
jgi:hypothetical protein